MFAHFTTPAELSFPRFSFTQMLARVATGLAAAEQRAKARRDYQRMLESDEIMRDVGLTRQDVYQAMTAMDR